MVGGHKLPPATRQTNRVTSKKRVGEKWHSTFSTGCGWGRCVWSRLETEASLITGLISQMPAHHPANTSCLPAEGRSMWPCLQEKLFVFCLGRFGVSRVDCKGSGSAGFLSICL